MHENEWLEKRLAYIRGLSAPNEQQRLLLMLAQLPQPTPNDRRKLGVLIRAEKAAERALKARADAAKVLNAERRAIRKARDHELYKAAGLMGVAGVVDRQTGRLNVDAGLLVGLLMELSAGTLPDSLHRETLKSRGDAAIAAREKKIKRIRLANEPHTCLPIALRSRRNHPAAFLPLGRETYREKKKRSQSLTERFRAIRQFVAGSGL